MVRTSRTLALTAVTTLAVGALGACGAMFPSKTHEDDASVQQKVTAVRLAVEDSGDVTVRGSEDTTAVTLRRVLRYQGERPEGTSHRVEDGVLVLDDCGEDCTVSYTLDVPAGLPVSGRKSSGDISLSRVGRVDVAVESGDVRLDGVAGDVAVRASSGDIRGDELRGARVRVEVTSGDVELSTATAQDVRARASSGDLTLTVPEGPYRVAARTDSGEESVRVPSDPGARHTLDLTTSSGNLTVDAG